MIWELREVYVAIVDRIVVCGDVGLLLGRAAVVVTRMKQAPEVFHFTQYEPSSTTARSAALLE